MINIDVLNRVPEKYRNNSSLNTTKFVINKNTNYIEYCCYQLENLGFEVDSIVPACIEELINLSSSDILIDISHMQGEAVGYSIEEITSFKHFKNNHNLKYGYNLKTKAKVLIGYSGFYTVDTKDYGFTNVYDSDLDTRHELITEYDKIKNRNNIFIFKSSSNRKSINVSFESMQFLKQIKDFDDKKSMLYLKHGIDSVKVVNY